MAETTPHTWTCPSCGRRVPLRASACHCGMTRARAEELATASAAATPARALRSPRPRLPVSGREVVAVMPGDVKALLATGALVMAAGLGWLVFGPSRPASTPALLGHVDAGPPPAPAKATPPRPPFKLPWWK
jgi:hypothetical protein